MTALPSPVAATPLLTLSAAFPVAPPPLFACCLPLFLASVALWVGWCGVLRAPK